jgi:protein-S-isoprenylcysteine O-methyltransferase Ste14
MYKRRLIFLINYLVLGASGAYGFDSLRLGVFLGVGIALFGALFALVCVSLGIVVHRSFPKKHEQASDFAELLTTGPYAYVRHPFYSVLIALNYAISMVFVSIYAIIASTLVIPLWWYLAKTEEVDLVHVWGKRYIAYRKQVPMFFPRAHQQTMSSQSE